ncbi:MAG: hypothetical protein JWN70_3434 [Planctomycetaceae bacterium]|nr:hypothetical protein [Planctomycetaceae bacterium]
MLLACDLPEGHCIFDSGLIQAFEHKWLESQRYGEDLGLLSVRDWCRRHWRTFQRFRRIEHLFGECRFQQFPAAEFGVWKGRVREEGSLFDIILGAFECGMENLEFVNWARLQRLPQAESYELFTLLDPNCVRLDQALIVQLAKERLVMA